MLAIKTPPELFVAIECKYPSSIPFRLHMKRLVFAVLFLSRIASAQEAILCDARTGYAQCSSSQGASQFHAPSGTPNREKVNISDSAGLDISLSTTPASKPLDYWVNIDTKASADFRADLSTKLLTNDPSEKANDASSIILTGTILNAVNINLSGYSGSTAKDFSYRCAQEIAAGNVNDEVLNYFVSRRNLDPNIPKNQCDTIDLKFISNSVHDSICPTGTTDLHSDDLPNPSLVISRLQPKNKCMTQHDVRTCRIQGYRYRCRAAGFYQDQNGGGSFNGWPITTVGGGHVQNIVGANFDGKSTSIMYAEVYNPGFHGVDGLTNHGFSAVIDGSDFFSTSVPYDDKSNTVFYATNDPSISGYSTVFNTGRPAWGPFVAGETSTGYGWGTGGDYAQLITENCEARYGSKKSTFRAVVAPGTASYTARESICGGYDSAGNPFYAQLPNVDTGYGAQYTAPYGLVDDNIASPENNGHVIKGRYVSDGYSTTAVPQLDSKGRYIPGCFDNDVVHEVTERVPQSVVFYLDIEPVLEDTTVTDKTCPNFATQDSRFNFASTITGVTSEMSITPQRSYQYVSESCPTGWSVVATDQLHFNPAWSESYACTSVSCPNANLFTSTVNKSLKTIILNGGQTGADRGKASVFVYDVKSVNVLAVPGADGAVGRIDLTIPSTVKNCASISDLTNAPTTQSSQSLTPSVTFSKVNYSAFDITSPDPTTNRIYDSTSKPYVYKRIDSSVRDWITKLSGN
jgi:hypothetical protein